MYLIAERAGEPHRRSGRIRIEIKCEAYYVVYMPTLLSAQIASTVWIGKRL
jgi:hypothetical protein